MGTILTDRQDILYLSNSQTKKRRWHMDQVRLQEIKNEVRQIILDNLVKEGYYVFFHPGELVRVWKRGDVQVLLGHIDLNERITAIRSTNNVRLLYKIKKDGQVRYKAFIYYPDKNTLEEVLNTEIKKISI